jgi:hypothetical protein
MENGRRFVRADAGNSLSVADKILRLATKDQAIDSPSGEPARFTGQASLDLLHQVAAVIRTNEARTDAVLQRAIDELKAAEGRIKALEARALQAETRAREAERWLARLHEAMQDKLAEWRTDEASYASGRRSAA